MNRSSLWHQVFISFLLFCCMSVCAQENNGCRDIIVLSHNNVDKEAIKSLFTAPVIIDELSFESDIVFGQEEFFHLFGIGKGDLVNQEQLIAGLELLAKKNKFSVVKVMCSTSDAGVKLHLAIEAAWTFKKIKIHNI